MTLGATTIGSTQMTEEPVEVIQADVDAAKAYWSLSVAGWHEQNAQQDALVRAFAAHRLSHSAEKQALIEECAAIADRYREDAGGSQSYRTACQHIAAAIRRTLNGDRP